MATLGLLGSYLISPLEKDQLLAVLVQMINVARTYAQAYSGGAQVFGDGDSTGIYEQLRRERLEL